VENRARPPSLPSPTSLSVRKGRSSIGIPRWVRSRAVGAEPVGGCQRRESAATAATQHPVNGPPF
jgi:hypothetical protein